MYIGVTFCITLSCFILTNSLLHSALTVIIFLRNLIRSKYAGKVAQLLYLYIISCQFEIKNNDIM